MITRFKRPPLFAVAPLLYLILLGFAIFNIALGYSLFRLHPAVPFVIIVRQISLLDWSVIFVLNGLTMLIGLWLNCSRLLRWNMILDLLIKMLWFFGVAFRIHEGGTLFFLVCWALIAYVQAIAVIYFTPEDHHVRPVA